MKKKKKGSKGKGYACRIAGICAIALMLAGCVTSGDLREVADSVARFEATLDDTTKTTEEVKAQAKETAEEIKVVAEKVEERTEGFVNGLGSSAEGGLVGLAGAALVYFLRNQREKKMWGTPDAPKPTGPVA